MKKLKKDYCDYCGKPIGESGKIYMAGSICEGHKISLLEYTTYIIKKVFKKV